jgi:glycosyltransferase involved in cell wall biosynthesis
MTFDSKAPLVSILIPAYNAERYIKEAIDSALMQDYPNMEILVIDDGSTDKTQAIVRAYADPRIRLLQQENRGIVRTRNRLLNEARGEYFSYLDSDDIYLQGRISKEVAFLEAHREYALVYCGIKYFFDGEPDKFYRHSFKQYSGDEVFPGLLEKMFITNTTITFRRKIYDTLGGYDPALGFVEDWEYFIRMVRNGFAIAYLNEDLVRFRLRWDSSTDFAHQVAIKESQVKIFEHVRASMTPQERERWNIDRRISERKKNYITMLLSNGEHGKAREVYGEIKGMVSIPSKVLISIMMIAPSLLMRFAVEKAWNARKRNLFIPL